MPYATWNDLIAQFDARDICGYASDTGVPIDPATGPTNTRVINALTTASAKVDALCERGQRYTRVQLAALVDPSNLDIQQGQLLRYIVCTLAMAQLVSTRVAGAKIAEVVYGYQDVQEILADLRGGAQTFDIPAALEAQVPVNTEPDPEFDVTRPSVWNPMFGRFTFPT
jgi:hypothetical protein